ncbi:hypothetical protein K2173_009318 [Erythroxylum novogranatense]|uniref:Reverse transcriptase n=1 Tax=Erythroxylum novogranatense TaxID=1862640 RepID=A0AAV8U3K7_9ROSI|nr:hypothetical protein K2173_009318 [Erythroxylum novogranatense]
MSGFREALSDAHLSDILQVGSSFTYTYREGSAACVKEKLDRACSTAEWSSLFRDVICSVLVAPVSDHSPLLIDTASTSSEGVHRRFRFDNSWLSEPNLGETSSTGVVLRLVKPLVDESANNALIAPFSDEEFRTALFQMNPNKAPGPDGLNPVFSKSFGALLVVTYVRLAVSGFN